MTKFETTSYDSKIMELVTSHVNNAWTHYFIIHEMYHIV